LLADEDALLYLNPGYRGRVVSRSGKLQKVLIANRGEIARRFFLTLLEMDIPTVAVVTDPDRGQSWYEHASEVVYIGDARNYVNPERLLAAVRLSQANAVYPGYGFLSESLNFARLLAAEGNVIFMGPKAEVMERVADKLSARSLAHACNVHLFPASGGLQNAEEAVRAFESMGGPALLKLNAGGGGKGMAIVQSEADVRSAVPSIMRLGQSIYNDSGFYMEKLIQKPSHIEVQAFNLATVGLRKCAVQRRNQKIIEETAVLPADLAEAFLEDAARILVAAGYGEAGAGTVEFLLDEESGEFGFLEMNTRLQVEYAVTDLSSGIDLVRCQIEHFDGSKVEPGRMPVVAHAIEVRLYAEDVYNNYAPAPGWLEELDLPGFLGVRTDSGYRAGDRILPDYDPMIAKVIVHGADRALAVARLRRALREISIRGVATNVPQLLAIASHPDFINGNYNNNLLKDNPELERESCPESVAEVLCLFAALCEYRINQEERFAESRWTLDLEKVASDPVLREWPNCFELRFSGRSCQVRIVQYDRFHFDLWLDGKEAGTAVIMHARPRDGRFRIAFAGQSYGVDLDRRPHSHLVRLSGADGGPFYLRLQIHPADEDRSLDGPGLVRAPFQSAFAGWPEEKPAVGDVVTAGQPLLVIEAMKMESVIRAPISGTLLRLLEASRESGRTFAEGELLAEISSDESALTRASLSVQSTDFKTALFAGCAAEELDSHISSDGNHLAFGLRLLRACFAGFYSEQGVLERLQACLERSGEPGEFATGRASAEIASIIEEILFFYASIKQLYSPGLREQFSFYSELSHVYMNRHDERFRMSFGLKVTLNQFFEKLGFADWEAQSEQREAAFFLLQRASRAALVYKRSLLWIVSLLRSATEFSSNLYQLISRLILIEQTEPENALALALRDLLEAHPALSRNLEALHGQSRKYFQEYRTFLRDPFALFGNYPAEQVRERMQQSLQAGVEMQLSGLREAEFQRRIALRRDIRVNRRLFVPDPAAALFELELDDGRREYACYVFLSGDTLELKYSEDGRVAASENLEQAGLLGIYLLWAYRQLREAQVSSLELIAGGDAPAPDFISADETLLNYTTLLKICYPIFRFFVSIEVDRVWLDLSPTGDHSQQRRIFSIYNRGGRLQLDKVFADDKNAAHWNGIESRSQRLYDRKKWPLEAWLEELLPQFAEIPLPGASRELSARLVHGLLDGRRVWVYLKDSRLRGGATGNEEGLLYALAVYLALRSGDQLFVVNDGAGANIREGMVALNRAAEGFFMNALVPAILGDRLAELLALHPDLALRELFTHADGLIALNPDKRNFMILAVGAGSSTGLDVYGSAQATLQLMMDHQESYRVLTGSTVIRSVTGESYTNYEIGGGRVMAHWTGTVDLLASDHFELLTLLRRVSALMDERVSVRMPASVAVPVASEDLYVISERFLQETLAGFLSLKADYVQAGALVGGVGRLSGERLLILGPRTHFGIRSRASVERARDLLRMARKTESATVLVSGRTWYNAMGEDDEALDMREDFLRTLKEKSGFRFVIITHAEGLQKLSLASSADVLIYTGKGNPSLPVLICQDLKEAFLRVEQIVAWSKKKGPSTGPGPTFVLPQSSLQAFDVQRVIESLLDQGSFLSFWAQHSAGFVTGIGRIAGHSIGVLADQPQIQGGAADAPGTRKFRKFMEIMERFQVPVLMLSSSPGFLPGLKQERLRIQQIGGESLDVNVQSRVPVLSVTLAQNYGGRQIQAFSKFLRPGITTFARRDSILAVMGATASFDLFHGKEYRDLLEGGQEERALRLREEYITKYNQRSAAAEDANRQKNIDYFYEDLRDLRQLLARSLEA